MKDSIYLHIPKTAGTALKVLVKQGMQSFKIARTHQTTIRDKKYVMFGVRDPWERFCSGFWEAKTLPLRHQLTMQQEETNDFNSFERLEESYPPWYKNIIDSSSTPDQFCSLLRTDSAAIRQLYNFDQGIKYKTHTPLGISTQSVTWWLGDLDEYKMFEHKVTRAIDIRSLRRFMSNYFNISMPTDAVQSRSREQFNMEQSYAASDDNLDWFVNFFRKADYILIEYIKQQPYYYNK
jgi:hypothetical protein